MPKTQIPKERKIDIFNEFQPIRIKYADVIDLKDFYATLHEWMLENEWKAEEDGELDHFETFYGERVSRDGGREIWIQWRLKKEPADVSAFVYYMDIYYHCIGISPAEIVKEGKKLKVNRGIVEMKIAAYIDEVYKQKFEKNSILKPLQKLFAKRLYREVTEQKRKEVYQEMYALQNFMKQYMKLKRYLPYEETKSFFPSYAWPSHQQEPTE